MAGQWKLMWWRFRRHRPAVVSAIFLALMYFSTAISEWIAPYDLHTRHSAYIFAPPQQVHVIHEGQFIGPFVYALKTTRDMETLQRVYTPDTTKPQPLRFFCRGDSYEFWGLIEGSFHFVCPPEGGTVLLAGHRPAGPRHVQPHRLCRAHLAHHRHHRHRALLRARPGPGRAGRLLRRLGRQRRPAHHRDHQELPAPAACGWRCRRRCPSPGRRC